MKKRVYSISLFFISSALLALEISLMRVLKVEGFGNFTYGAIALALTGFGASGTFICLFREKIKNLELELSYWAAVFFILFLGIGSYLSGKVRFDPLIILWDKSQILRLLVRYAFYTIPFIIGSSFVVLAFTLMKAGRAYFFNLSGSGFGIFIILICLYLIPPKRILIVPLVLAFISLLLFLFSWKPITKKRLYALPLAAAGFIFFFASGINVLPYKGKELALNLPDAEIIHTQLSPFGTVEVVRSTKLRMAHGLSYTYEGKLPEQHGLYIDGDFLSAVDRITGDHSMDYLLYQVQSAVYTLHDNPEVFIVGFGGGMSAERAYRNGAKEIIVSEENPYLSPLLQNTFQRYNNGFFHKNDISIANTDGRSFIHQSAKLWDIIDVSETAGFSQSIGGIYSADTNYTLTVNAFQDYLEGIHEEGTVSATLPLKYPPRNLLKLTALAKEALRREGLEYTKNIVVIRSWSSGTVLIKKGPFTGENILKIKRFCKKMLFDLVYYPGIDKAEVNRYNIVQDALYYNSVIRILQGNGHFLKRYVFNITPPTDNKPYFSYFFKPGKMPHLFKTMGKKWLFVVEGGYIVLFSTFVATVILSGVFIFLPLFILKKKIETKKIPVVLYFSLIAVAYMFIEILLMQKFSKYITNPLYSNSMVIASLLIFSGIGSYLSDSMKAEKTQRHLLQALIFLSAYFLLFFLIHDLIFQSIIRASMISKLLVAVAVSAPAGFVMGLFFPTALSLLQKRDAYSLPWAWSVNGFFSVIASTGVVLVASNTGFLLTGIIALSCYWTAMLFFNRITGR